MTDEPVSRKLPHRWTSPEVTLKRGVTCAEDLHAWAAGTVGVGPAGADTTRAAEEVADRLGVPLQRVDLSALVGEDIGETERNLALEFDAAQRSGSVLVLDEAGGASSSSRRSRSSSAAPSRRGVTPSRGHAVLPGAGDPSAGRR